MNPRQQFQTRGSSQKFFLRGLGILLPTVLTIWILATAYSFVDQKIAMPINAGVKELIIRGTPLPIVTDDEIREFHDSLTADQRGAMRSSRDQEAWLERQTRRDELERAWRRVSIGN